MLFFARFNDTTSSSIPDTSKSTFTPQNHTGVIVGGVLGGIAGLGGLMFIIFHQIRRRRTGEQDGTRVEPYVYDRPDAEGMIMLHRNTPSALEKGSRSGSNNAVRLYEQPLRTSHRDARSGVEASSDRNNECNTDITNRLDSLRNEIARLEGQQQVIINELRPPPGYSR